MAKVWESISELEETPWSTAVPRKIRKSLDAVQEGMRNLPNRVRQYEPFEHAQVCAKYRGLWCLGRRVIVSMAVQGQSVRAVPSRTGVCQVLSVFFCGVFFRVCVGLGRYVAISLAAARNIQKSFLVSISRTMLVPNTKHMVPCTVADDLAGEVRVSATADRAPV